MKTKDKILLTAKTIYNEKGYKNTSTRDIAKELNISPGNLHYHYAHASTIVIELFQEFATKMNHLLEQAALSDLTTLDLFFNYVVESIELFFNYKFLFVNFTDILRENEAIRNLYKDIHKRRKVEFEELFKSFQEKKIFKENIPNFIITNLIEQMFIVGDSVISYNEITHQLTPQKAVDYYSKIFMTQFYYLLTEENQKDFESYIDAK